MITTYHNISFGTQTVPEQIPVVQGDTGREIVFILTDFTIPEGATATYYVQKPSGEAVYNSATISENNIIVALTAQSIIEVGENDMQVRVILGEDIVTSFRAILMVRPFLGIGAVESSTEINIFDQAVEDAYERITEEVVWPANFYGTCQTAAATQDKTVTVQGGFILKSGVVVNVMCAFTNSASQITLNVNNTGAKAVYYRGSKVSGDMLVANGMYTFVYANSHWNMAGLNGKLLQLDDTFTVSGKAADSKATGDRFDAVEADVTALQAELPDLTEAIMSAFVVDTASGAIATFSDGADGIPVADLTVEIEPVQDLHGQTSPYPAGGGKNKVDISQSAYYSSGSTEITVTQGGYYANIFAEVNGTSNPLPSDKRQILPLSAGEWVLSYETSDSGDLILQSVNVTDGTRENLTATSSGTSGSRKYAVYTLESAIYASISRVANVTRTFNKIQLESGSTPTAWSPYSNICTITGHTQAVVTRTGKNLLDPALKTEDVSVRKRWAWNDGLMLKGGETYTFSAQGQPTGEQITMYIAFFDGTSAISGTNSVTYSPQKDTLVKLQAYRDNGISDNAQYQLEVGSTATAYEPYQGETYTIDLNGTRYGGTLDVGTGVLTVTHKRIELDADSLSSNPLSYQRFAMTVNDYKSPSASIADSIVSNMLKTSSKATLHVKDFAISGDNEDTNAMLLRFDSSVDTLEKAKNFLTNNQVVVVYPLATPLTVQLTAEEVTTLLGTNNIFADCGDVTCQYRADTKLYIDKILNA